MSPPVQPDQLEAGINKNAPHIFRQALGHFSEDTPAIRQLLIDTAMNPNYHLGQDKYKTDWYSQILPSGAQVWVQVRKGEIRNAGINATPRTWHPDTGLAGSPELN
ncbi:hypothetical protein [Leptolyngbya sp. PCC 6406]|uniref:hypothetical protein n=1 Tax=Leptolyngbya sp. PCC 6406 TaxID=1173264 RepID=UPI0002ACC01C|nr:hypothetical protein [Leptolyngbya sp. PCC 6406]